MKNYPFVLRENNDEKSFRREKLEIENFMNNGLVRRDKKLIAVDRRLWMFDDFWKTQRKVHRENFLEIRKSH